MKIREITEEALRDTGSGKSADICAKAVLCSIIREKEPFQAIELKDQAHLHLMMKEADLPHIYCEGGVFYFSAYYLHDERYPAGRNYFIRERDLVEASRKHHQLSKQGVELPFFSAEALSKKIDQEGFETRIANFRKRQAEETKWFRGLFEGRSNSTGVEKSIFLNSPGCLVCGSDDFYMTTSTLSAEKGFMIGLNLCKSHMEQAKSERSLIEYLAKLFNQPSPIKNTPLTTEDHLKLVLSWLPKKLDSRIDKVNKNTVTMTRPSGLKVIFRLDSPKNYAYIIINKNGKEIARIDSADHHSVNYGPDHLHTDTTKKKTKVESSFTTGSPLIDTKKILEIIQLKEAELRK